MIIVRNSKSNYPFTASSTMLVGNGLRIGPGVIRSANLFPHCGQINYLYVSEIGRNRDLNMIVSDDSDREVAVVTFTPNGGLLTGVASDSYGTCGVVTATEELLPVLNAHHYPAKDSFVFSPSAVFPKTDYSAATGFRSANGSSISSLTFDDQYFSVDSDSEITVDQKHETTELPVPVSKILINGVALPAEDSSDSQDDAFPEYANIMPRRGSRIRIVQDGGSIVLEEYDGR